MNPITSTCSRSIHPFSSRLKKGWAPLFYFWSIAIAIEQLPRDKRDLVSFNNTTQCAYMNMYTIFLLCYYYYYSLSLRTSYVTHVHTYRLLLLLPYFIQMNATFFIRRKNILIQRTMHVFNFSLECIVGLLASLTTDNAMQYKWCGNNNAAGVEE